MPYVRCRGDKGRGRPGIDRGCLWVGISACGLRPSSDGIFCGSAPFFCRLANMISRLREIEETRITYCCSAAPLTTGVVAVTRCWVRGGWKVGVDELLLGG